MSEAKQEVQVQTVGSDLTPQNEAASLFSVIERAARDQSVDIDKLERLMSMHERMIARQAEQAFNAAMAAAQSEMRPVVADATNPQTRSRYASYAALDHALRPIYTRHGFALSFNTADTDKADTVVVVCRISHRDGHSETHHVPMPADGKGAKGGDVMTKTHATGSAMSYGMRYLLKLVFNIAVTEHDDDGNAAGSATLTEAQIADLEAKIEETGADRQAFLKYAKVSDPAYIRQSAYTPLIRKLEEAGKRRQQT
jgi:hypothetical protein